MVRIYCFGSGLPESPFAFVPSTIPSSGTLAPGQSLSFSLSSELTKSGFKPGTFTGYVIADCAFAGAYGMAQVTNQQSGTTPTGAYLAIVLSRNVVLSVLSLTSTTSPIPARFFLRSATHCYRHSDGYRTDGHCRYAPEHPEDASAVKVVPTTMTVSKNSASQSFTFNAPLEKGSVTITALLNGDPGASQPLTIEFAGIIEQVSVGSLLETSLTLNKGQSTTGQVQLFSIVSEDTVIALGVNGNDDNGKPLLSLSPTSLTINKGGFRSGSFTVTASNTGTSAKTATVTATYPSDSQPVNSKPITVNP